MVSLPLENSTAGMLPCQNITLSLTQVAQRPQGQGSNTLNSMAGSISNEKRAISGESRLCNMPDDEVLLPYSKHRCEVERTDGTKITNDASFIDRLRRYGLQHHRRQYKPSGKSDSGGKRFAPAIQRSLEKAVCLLI